MKIRYFFACLMLFTGLGLGAQNVPEVQQSLLTKVTATWCPNCGTWGWTFYEDILEDNADKAVLLTAHHSGGLMSEVAVAFYNNFQSNYQPQFLLGNENQNVTSSNGAEKRTAIKNLVDANYLAAPVVNTGMTANMDGNTLNFTTKTRFFQAASGDFYLGLYILEDGVMHTQSGISGTPSHHSVLRASFTSEHFGLPVASGDIAAGAEYDHTFSLDLDPAWNQENIEVMAVIWNKIEETYTFVNTNSTTELTSTATAETKATVTEMSINPTIASAAPTVSLDLANTANIQLDVFDQTGKLAFEVFNGKLQQGNHQFDLAAKPLGKGLYFVRMQTGNQEIITKKFMLE